MSFANYSLTHHFNDDTTDDYSHGTFYSHEVSDGTLKETPLLKSLNVNDIRRAIHSVQESDLPMYYGTTLSMGYL